MCDDRADVPGCSPVRSRGTLSGHGRAASVFCRSLLCLLYCFARQTYIFKWNTVYVASSWILWMTRSSSLAPCYHLDAFRSWRMGRRDFRWCIALTVWTYLFMSLFCRWWTLECFRLWLPWAMVWELSSWFPVAHAWVSPAGSVHAPPPSRSVVTSGCTDSRRPVVRKFLRVSFERPALSEGWWLELVAWPRNAFRSKTDSFSDSFWWVGKLKMNAF